MGFGLSFLFSRVQCYLVKPRRHYGTVKYLIPAAGGFCAESQAAAAGAGAGGDAVQAVFNGLRL